MIPSPSPSAFCKRVHPEGEWCTGCHIDQLAADSEAVDAGVSA